MERPGRCPFDAGRISPAAEGSEVGAEILPLLRADDAAVRAFAALALGRLGRSSARFTPHLLQALKRAEAEELGGPGKLRPSYFSGDAICQAFAEIGVSPVGVRCREGLYW